MAFSPDSRFIATGSHAGKINLIGVESGKKESALDTRGKFTMSIAYVCGFNFVFNVMACTNVFTSRDGAVVRVLTSHQRGLGLIPRPGVIFYVD